MGKQAARIAGLFLMLVAAACARDDGDTSPQDETAPQQVESETGAVEAEPGTEGVAASQPADEAAPPAVDPEVEAAARLEVSRRSFGDEGPRTCTTTCDCPPGSGCQPDAQICIEGLGGTTCCTWPEEHCRPNAACITPEGENGMCPGSDPPADEE